MDRREVRRSGGTLGRLGRVCLQSSNPILQLDDHPESSEQDRLPFNVPAGLVPIVGLADPTASGALKDRTSLALFLGSSRSLMRALRWRI